MTEEVLGRILGPAGETLSCEECFHELDRYVEWKLADPDGRFERCSFCGRPHECVQAYECLAMRNHLASCPACNEEYESLRDLVLAERDG